jgi:hypothetical protein
MTLDEAIEHLQDKFDEIKMLEELLPRNEN